MDYIVRQCGTQKTLNLSDLERLNGNSNVGIVEGATSSNKAESGINGNISAGVLEEGISEISCQ